MQFRGYKEKSKIQIHSDLIDFFRLSHGFTISNLIVFEFSYTLNVNLVFDTPRQMHKKVQITWILLKQKIWTFLLDKL